MEWGRVRGIPCIEGEGVRAPSGKSPEPVLSWKQRWNIVDAGLA